MKNSNVIYLLPLSLICISIMLAGCSIGPTYIRPDAPAPVQYKADAPWREIAPQDTLAKGEWWKLYGDPVLNELEEQALTANQSLKAGIARLDQILGTELGAKAARLPQLDLQASAQRQGTAADFSSTGEHLVGSSFMLPINLSYEFDLWGRVRRTVEAAGATSEGAVADYQSLLLSIQSEVARIYFSIRATDTEIELINTSMKLLEETRDLIKRQYDNGLVSKLDLARAETQVEITRSDAIGLEKIRGELENGLATLIGKAASDFNLVTTVFENEVPLVAAGLPSSLLERRPDVAAAERSMAAASARIGVAKSAFFPSISLTGNAGYASADIDNLFSWSNRAWGLGPAIHLPIFDGKRNKANLIRAKAAYEESVAHYRQQVLVAFQEVEDSLNGLEILSRQQVALEKSVATADEAVKISLERYRHGRVNFLEVVDSERTSLDVQRSLNRLRNQQFATSVLLIKALGGGWPG